VHLHALVARHRDGQVLCCSHPSWSSHLRQCQRQLSLIIPINLQSRPTTVYHVMHVRCNFCIICLCKTFVLDAVNFTAPSSRHIWADQMKLLKLPRDLTHSSARKCKSTHCLREHIQMHQAGISGMRGHLISQTECEAAIQHGEGGRKVHDRQRLPCAAARTFHEGQKAPRLAISALGAAGHPNGHNSRYTHTLRLRGCPLLCTRWTEAWPGHYGPSPMIGALLEHMRGKY